MSHLDHCTAAPAPAWWPSLTDATGAVQAFARSVDAWWRTRMRAATDRRLLASMSERELNDIGIMRTATGAITDRLWIPKDLLRI